MGYTPAEVDEMSLWEFASCAEGYRKANSPAEKPSPPTPAEFEEMVERHRHMQQHTKH